VTVHSSLFHVLIYRR